MSFSPPLERYVLHHRIHEFWGQSQLCFIRLGFVVYNRDEVMEGIDELCSAIGSTSFTVYELLGEYDILVRAWIPIEKHRPELMEAVTANLVRAGLDQQKIGLSLAQSTDRHWVFKDSRGGSIEPTEGRLSRLPSGEESLRINRTLSGEEAGLTITEINNLVDDGILGRLTNPHELDLRELTAASPGIKFATFIRTSTLSNDERRRLRQHINTRVQTLAVLVDESQQKLVTQLSLYWTPMEPDTEFIIMGRIRPESFHHAIGDLVEFVIDPGMRVFGAHPVTNIFARPDFVTLKEALPASMVGAEVSPSLSAASIEELLAMPESARVELKASVYVDVQRWLFAGGIPALSEDLFMDGIIRTVAAFLNSPQVGVGRLIVGAYELTPGLQRALDSSPQEVQSRYGELPKVGRCLIVGIQPDIQALRGAGRNIGDADGLMVHVAQRLENALKPSGANVTSAVLEGVEINSHTVEGRMLLDIQVTTTAPRAWFRYDGPDGETFTIRSSNHSRDLSRDDEWAWRERWSLGKNQ